jgi:hypothetical protein
MNIQKFEQLEVWKRAHALVLVSCSGSSFINSTVQEFRSRATKRRKILAQDASPGFEGPHPVRQLTDTPLPRGRERGRGEGRCLIPRLGRCEKIGHQRAGAHLKVCVFRSF